MICINFIIFPDELAVRGVLRQAVTARLGFDNFLNQTARFIEEFYDNSDSICVLTSGSTGKPKPMRVKKAQMRQSAAMTIRHLGLKQGQSAYLCMPLEHIAGKMMVIRALCAGLNLITARPCADPFAAAPHSLDFAAITPMQAACSLELAQSAEKLASCKQIIVGGGFIAPALAAKLSALGNTIYHSYGMTETLSHIALRRVSTDLESTPFYPLPGVSIRLNEEQTLCINAPALCDEELATHDLAELTDDGGFFIRGRLDNVINSGGIKLIPEQIERKLAPELSVPFAISSRPSLRYGEEVVLVCAQAVAQRQLDRALAALSRYERPKAVIVQELPLTATQKIDRKNLRDALARTVATNPAAPPEQPTD